MDAHESLARSLEALERSGAEMVRSADRGVIAAVLAHYDLAQRCEDDPPFSAVASVWDRLPDFRRSHLCRTSAMLGPDPALAEEARTPREDLWPIDFGTLRRAWPELPRAARCVLATSAARGAEESDWMNVEGGL